MMSVGRLRRPPKVLSVYVNVNVVLDVRVNKRIHCEVIMFDIQQLQSLLLSLNIIMSFLHGASYKLQR